MPFSPQAYDSNDNESASTRNGSEAESPQLSSRLPFFHRLFCCGRRSLSKHCTTNCRTGEDAVGALVEKEGVRNKLQMDG